MYEHVLGIIHIINPDKCHKQILWPAFQLGSQVVIITNSGFGWVHETASRFMPSVLGGEAWSFTAFCLTGLRISQQLCWGFEDLRSDRVLLAIHFRLKCGCVFDCQDCKGLAMARSSKLITLCVALVAFVALRSVAFLGAPGPQAQLRGTPLEIAAGAAVPAVLMTPTAAMAADGGMPSVVLGVGILCMLAAFSAVSSVISATVTSELDWVHESLGRSLSRGL